MTQFVDDSRMKAFKHRLVTFKEDWPFNEDCSCTPEKVESLFNFSSYNSHFHQSEFFLFLLIQILSIRHQPVTHAPMLTNNWRFSTLHSPFSNFNKDFLRVVADGCSFSSLSFYQRFWQVVVSQKIWLNLDLANSKLLFQLNTRRDLTKKWSRMRKTFRPYECMILFP